MLVILGACTWGWPQVKWVDLILCILFLKEDIRLFFTFDLA